MSGKTAALRTILALFIATAQLPAKGNTVRISIRGGSLAEPIEIRDPAITGRFNVWTGPGTGRLSPDRKLIPTGDQGLIADWARGVTPPPAGLPVYEVSFVTTRNDPGTYKVRYAIDPSTNTGYIYIPGKADSEYRDNTWLIYRGIEGNWFHASSAWDQVAHRAIANALKAR